MEQPGFLKVYRKLQDNPLWQDKPFSRGQAWIDILFLAQLEEVSFLKRGTKVIVKRGQVGRSMKGLSARWGWSIGKTRRFLLYLENENQIEHQINNVTTLITVVNYDEYNQTETKTERQRKPNGNQTETYKEVKNEKKKEYVEIIEFLNVTTGRSYKATTESTQRAISGRLSDGYTVEDFKSVIASKSNEWLGSDMEKFLTPDTLFRPSNFEKYLQNVTGSKEEHDFV